MPNRTPIEWADYSSNPVKARHRATGKQGWACVRVSDGCLRCYAATLNRRLGTGLDYTVPALSSGPFATESTVTVTGLSTQSVLVLQNRLINNSTANVSLAVRCSTVNELTIQFINESASSLSGSTQSAYLLQFNFA